MVYSNEALPIFFASLKFPHSTFAVHDFPERHRWFWRTLFQQMENLLATNAWKKREIVKTFNIQPEKIFVEPNAVDIKSFEVHDSEHALRKKFNIEGFSRIVLYTGHLYEWKGVNTLGNAAKLLPKNVGVVFVGGTDKDVERFRLLYGTVSNVRIIGQRPHTEIPLWQSVADILVLPNSGKSMLSSHYTSPMKLFEYMASGKPIVASRISSITEHLDDTCAVLISPDQEVKLAGAIKKLIADPSLCDTLGKSAHIRGENYTWEARAKRILMLWHAEKPTINP
jgi:glycosyltransferase involved in cell wall biosynthesis